MAADTLPKYIQKANQIIKIISEQPDRIWNQTQRELGERLGFSQPELSNLLGSLVETGKIRKGRPLPGIRGRNYAIELLDAEPLDGPIRRKKIEDRVLEPGEAIDAPLDLQALTLDQIGAAVIRTIKDTWDKAERTQQTQSEYLQKIKQLREQLTMEREFRSRYAAEKENLQRTIQEREEEITRIREELNRVLVAANGHKGKTNGKTNGSSFTVKEMLSENDLHVLENLMKVKSAASS